MLYILISRSGQKHEYIIFQKSISDFNRLYKILKKYQRFKYDLRYRIRLYSNDNEGIKFIVNSFMPSEYMNIINSINDIKIELTLDLIPVIAEIDTDEYHFYDFHSDCIELNKGDIIYSFKDNQYFLIRHDPNKVTIGSAIRDAHDCDSYYMISRMDIRKASKKEIKLYGLDKLRDIYNTSSSSEEFNRRLNELRNTYPRLN